MKKDVYVLFDPAQPGIAKVGVTTEAGQMGEHATLSIKGMAVLMSAIASAFDLMADAAGMDNSQRAELIVTGAMASAHAMQKMSTFKPKKILLSNQN
jgi:hypothetical protein